LSPAPRRLRHRVMVAGKYVFGPGKADVLAAGFKLDGESSILANTSDDHTKNVFDPSVRGHTDQFLFRFRKPK